MAPGTDGRPTGAGARGTALSASWPRGSAEWPAQGRGHGPWRPEAGAWALVTETTRRSLASR